MAQFGSVRLTLTRTVGGAIAIAATMFAATVPASAKLGSCTDPVVFGTTISESGPFSTLTANWRKMTEIFADEINKEGGIKLASCGGKGVPLKFAIYDDQSVPATAVQLYERMASVDQVDFFVGPDWSSLGGPVPPIAERHGIPIVMGNVATPALYQRATSGCGAHRRPRFLAGPSGISTCWRICNRSRRPSCSSPTTTRS